MCPPPLLLRGEKVATKTGRGKTGRTRNAAGQFESAAGGTMPGSAKRVMKKKAKEAWPVITDMLVETAKKGDFRATKWLWDECGLGTEAAKQRRGTKMGFAQTMIEELKREQAAAEAAKTGTTK